MHASQPLDLCFADRPVASSLRSLQRLGVHGHMLGATQSLYDGPLPSMRVGGQCSAAQPIHLPQAGLPAQCHPFWHLQRQVTPTICRPLAPAAGVQVRYPKLMDLVYAGDIALWQEHLQALSFG